MADILDSVAVGNSEGAATELGPVWDSNGGYLAVADNDVYVQLGVQAGQVRDVQYTDPLHVPTGNVQLYAGTVALRVWNYVAGSQALVSAALFEKSEPVLTLAAGGVAGGASSVIPVNTVFPGSPSDGQQVLIVDNTSAPTYAWHFVWNAAANLWVFVGGSDLRSEVMGAGGYLVGDALNSSGVYTDLATVGPTVTVPNTGTTWTLELEHGYQVNRAGADVGTLASPKLGGAATADANAVGVVSQFASPNTDNAKRLQTVSVAAGAILKVQYKTTSANTAACYARFLAVRPVSVTP